MKSRKNITAIAIGICLLTGFAGCKKPREQPCFRPCQINTLDGFKAWYYYNEGTYWIYEEESSGVLDTLTVYASLEYQIDDVEHFEYKAYSSHTSRIHTVWFNDTWDNPCPIRQECGCSVLHQRASDTNGPIGDSWYFSYPHYENGFLSLPLPTQSEATSNYSTITEMSDSTEVFPGVYGDQVIWEIELDELHTDQPTRYTYAKGIGLTKLELLEDEESWVLVDYYVVP